MNKTLVVIGGPTAVGKTSVAITVARAFSTSILSADSRQCYRELTIGTAKPSQEELFQVPHYFINSHSIEESISAGGYNRYARNIMKEVFRENDYLVMTGGTGMYIRAALEGIDDIPEADPELRVQLNRKTLSELQELMRVHDPDYIETVDMQNPQRLVRALEVSLSSGKPYSSFLNRIKDPLPYKVVKVALDMDREKLYDRINRRVGAMVAQGLFDEADALSGYRDHYALKTVGYTEVFEYLDGRLSHEEAIEAIKQNTRRYAKRQLTWFRKNDEYKWFSSESGREIVQFVKEISHQSNH